MGLFCFVFGEFFCYLVGGLLSGAGCFLKILILLILFPGNYFFVVSFQEWSEKVDQLEKVSSSLYLSL